MRKRLILIGGSAGSGKTTVAQTLAGSLGAGWLQLDTVWIAMKAAADQGSPAFSLLDVAGRMHRGGDSDEDLLAAHIAASQAVCDVLPEVFSFELDTHQVLVADGAWLLPSFIAGLDLPDTEVRCIFLQHADEDGVAAALGSRLGDGQLEARHMRMNRQIWQYGAWVCERARDRDLSVLDSRPFATLTDRARAALALEPGRQDPRLAR